MDRTPGNVADHDTDTTIGVAFVGLGRIASLLEDDPLREKPASHAGAVFADERCRFLGGFDTSTDRRRAFAQRWGTRSFDSVEELFQQDPGILVIATHPDSHYRYLSAAVGAKIPVAIIEKPISNSYFKGQRMLRYERAGRIKVVVNHERRFSRDYQIAKSAVDDHRMGALIGVTGRLFFGSKGRHDRVFLHDGTHLVDVIHFLTSDRITLKHRVGRYRSTRSSVFLHGELRSRDIPVVIEVGAQRRYLQFEVTLSFTDGEITVGNGIFRWSKAQASPYYSAYRSLVDQRRIPPEPSGYFAGMLHEAVRLYNDPQGVSRSKIADGLAALRVIRDAGRLI